MTVTITINNVWSRISDLKDLEIVDALDKITSFYVEGYQYTKAFKTGWYDQRTGEFKHWDGKKHLLTQKMVFPTGLLHRVKGFFDLYKIEYVINDKRKVPKKYNELPIHHYTPRYYQTEALEAAIKNERGMIRLGTGGGKTLIASMITAKYNLPTMIYVIGKDLLYQFHKEFEKALNIKVGIIGDGKCDIRQVNICSIWTAITAFNFKNKQVSLDDEDWSPEIQEVSSENKKLIKKTIENSMVNIFDEAHYLATDTIQSIYKASKKCRYLFGMSGTDWRTDGADLLIESICGPRIYNKTSSELIKAGYLVPPKFVLFDVPHIAELPSNYQSIYSKYITNNDVRNTMIVESARNLINMGRRVLILVRYISQGNIIEKMLSDIPLYFVNGEVDSDTRKEVKESFECGDLKCLIASSVFDIGIDIPSLDGLVLAGGGKSSVRALQRVGRVIRNFKDKNDAIVVDFIDNAKYLIKHSAIRISVYETEPLFKLKFPKDFDQKKIKRSRKVIKEVK
jgi:superfamily II DNA or RNA helicase